MKTSFLVLVLLAVCHSASARIMQGCSYEEMFSKADLVVIAQPLGTKDTTEKTSWQNIVPAFRVVGVESDFKVSTIVKGNKDTKDFILHHYRAVDLKEERNSGPTLLHFDPKVRRCFFALSGAGAGWALCAGLRPDRSSILFCS